MEDTKLYDPHSLFESKEFHEACEKLKKAILENAKRQNVEVRDLTAIHTGEGSGELSNFTLSFTWTIEDGD